MQREEYLRIATEKISKYLIIWIAEFELTLGYLKIYFSLVQYRKCMVSNTENNKKYLQSLFDVYGQLYGSLKNMLLDG